MQRKRLQSAMIKEIGYCTKCQVLEIKFANDAVYQYKCGPYLYKAITNKLYENKDGVPSHGATFERMMQHDRSYPHTQISGPIPETRLSRFDPNPFWRCNC